MEFVERNYKILEQRMIDQMELSLNYGKNLIDNEVKAGVLNVIIKPIIKSFYKYWSEKDARVGTLEQIKITLNAAKELVNNGVNSKEKFDKIIDENFPLYLKNDQTDRVCKGNHKNYKLLKEITRKCFISQVEESLLFLNVKKDDIQTYNELSVATFKTKEIAYPALMRQLDYKEEGIQIVSQDDSILKIPVGKKIILNVLKKGFDLTKKQLFEDLDIIFN